MQLGLHRIFRTLPPGLGSTPFQLYVKQKQALPIIRFDTQVSAIIQTQYVLKHRIHRFEDLPANRSELTLRNWIVSAIALHILVID